MYISLMTAEPKQSLKESIMGPTSCETGEKKLVFSKQTWGKQSVQNIQEQISQVNPRIKFCIEQICDWSQNQNKLSTRHPQETNKTSDIPTSIRSKYSFTTSSPNNYQHTAIRFAQGKALFRDPKV